MIMSRPSLLLVLLLVLAAGAHLLEEASLSGGCILYLYKYIPVSDAFGS